MPKQNPAEMFSPIPLADVLTTASWVFAKMALAASSVKGGDEIAGQNLRLAKAAMSYKRALNEPAPRRGEGRRWVKFIRDYWPATAMIDAVKAAPVESAEFFFAVRALLQSFDNDAFEQATRSDVYYTRRHIMKLPEPCN